MVGFRAIKGAMKINCYMLKICCCEPRNLANWPAEFEKVCCGKLWSLLWRLMQHPVAECHSCHHSTLKAQVNLIVIVMYTHLHISASGNDVCHFRQLPVWCSIHSISRGTCCTTCGNKFLHSCLSDDTVSGGHRWLPSLQGLHSLCSYCVTCIFHVHQIFANSFMSRIKYEIRYTWKFSVCIKGLVNTSDTEKCQIKMQRKYDTFQYLLLLLKTLLSFSSIITVQYRGIIGIFTICIIL